MPAPGQAPHKQKKPSQPWDEQAINITNINTFLVTNINIRNINILVVVICSPYPPCARNLVSQRSYQQCGRLPARGPWFESRPQPPISNASLPFPLSGAICPHGENSLLATPRSRGTLAIPCHVSLAPPNMGIHHTPLLYIQEMPSCT